MEKLSAFVTTFNNAHTLHACLDSVKWADEIVVLDSFSTDETMQIAESFGAKTFQHKFLGYGPQKQSALEKTSHRWVLLLDADEALSPELQREVQQLLENGPECDGYELPRQEQMFWQMASTKARLNGFLRLFDKTRAHVSDMPIHAAPKVDGKIGRLNHAFYHFGEVDIHTKVDKINHYSTGLVADKIAKGKHPSPWIMIFYPPLFFLRQYFFKRNFLNGWSGFIASIINSHYAFLKYAKLFEYAQQQKYGTSLLPKCAPEPEQKTRPK
ncbi:MAG TPA: glycosyltransferase family 2 protein [Malonomonas sp.]